MRSVGKDDMSSEHNFESPERFIVGTVGNPGERTFYLQVVKDGAIVTVSLEKAEVAALAEGLQVLLQQVGSEAVDADEPAPLDSLPLETPFAEDFRVSELSVAWDGRHVVVEAGGAGEGGPADGMAKLRVAMSVPATQAFVSRAEKVVAAGRPPCVLCGQPASVDTHICPRLN
jgi:uncharacterized repeat protein (TIGR03847 family)